VLKVLISNNSKSLKCKLVESSMVRKA